MKKLNLVCKVRMKKYRFYKGEVGKIAPNLLERDFEAKAPEQKWVTDVIEFSFFGEKRYLSVILDLHSSDIISYTLSDNPNLSMVTDMIFQALPALPPGAAPILHSDQGWQYQHKQYQKLLKDNGIRQSMIRKETVLTTPLWRTALVFLKTNWFIYWILNPWNIFAANWLSILITTTTIGLRLN